MMTAGEISELIHNKEEDSYITRAKGGELLISIEHLMSALLIGLPKVVAYLLQNLSITAQSTQLTIFRNGMIGEAGLTALMVAALYGELNIVKFLIEERNANRYTESSLGRTALMMTVGFRCASSRLPTKMAIADWPPFL